MPVDLKKENARKDEDEDKDNQEENNGREEVELIADKFKFVVIDEGRRLPYTSSKHMYFTTDESFIYTPLKDDVGPLCLGLLYKYCKLLKARFQDPENKEKRFYHVTNGNIVKRTNSAYLACCFMIIMHGMKAEELVAKFSGLHHPFSMYHDCWKSPLIAGISVFDCMLGVQKAIANKFFSYESFNVEEYDRLQEVNNGDMNWIVPGRMLAFKGPRTTPKNQPAFTPDHYLPLLQQMGISAVVRLCKNHYDETIFTKNGLLHHEFFFSDGTVPDETIVTEFLSLAKASKGGLAVHCKGGIGRTGTLIGCYLIQEHNFTAEEAIAWIRICRPGSIMGQQHVFLLNFGQQNKIKSVTESQVNT